MKKTLFFFLVFLCASSVPAQWEERTNGLPDEYPAASCLSAADKDIAAITTAWQPDTPSYLYKTTDAGMNWIGIPTTPGSATELVDVVEIIDSDNIWAGTNAANPYTARIYYTSDGGNTWELQYEDPQSASFINYIEMFDAENGIAMCDPPSDSPAVFLRTTDRGENWISMNQDYLLGCYSGDQWRRIDFVNINVGYFFESGINPQKIYKTTDGGATWEIKSPDDAIKCLKFYNENYGFAGTFGNIIYRTTDGGNNWDEITVPVTAWMTSFGYITDEPEKVWLVAAEHLLFSADSGNTWNEQPMDISYIRGSDIEFVDNHYGWLYADNLPEQPKVFYTTDGGSIIVSVKNEIKTPGDFYLGQNYPNPFNPETNIEYSVTGYGLVKLAVYNVLGEEVSTLVNEVKSAGSYQVRFNADNLPGGVYFYRITGSEGNGVTKKMVLVK